MIRAHRKTYGSPGRQRGAALYVALVMLILLALIGIVGMQVATLQERMAANYLAVNMAFQRAEGVVRGSEADIMGGLASAYEDCATPFDSEAWIDGVDAGDSEAVRVVNIGRCIGECSLLPGSDPSECRTYRITGFSRDRDDAAASSSLAAIDTIFIKP